MALQLKSIAVLGAGTMGRGIAQWFCQQGVQVELADTKLDIATDAQKAILKSWQKLAEKGKFSEKEITSFNNCLLPVEASQLSHDPDLFIEAIIENYDIKIKVLSDLDKKFDAKTIMASNTSSFPIASMAKHLSTSRQERFLGLHFFNPAPIMKLVEIIQSPWSSEKLCQDLSKWFLDKGKKPATCKDRPGFIVNRVARNFYGESLRIASIDKEENFREVDTILKEVGGFAMGPFELMDLIGIDVNYSVTNSVWDAFFKEARFAPHGLQKEMVDAGRLGRKTKRGFYSYE